MPACRRSCPWRVAPSRSCSRLGAWCKSSRWGRRAPRAAGKDVTSRSCCSRSLPPRRAPGASGSARPEPGRPAPDRVTPAPVPVPATAVELGRLSPAAFRRLLAAAGIRRFFLAWDEEAGDVRASHPELAPLARLLAADRRDFDRHEGIFVQVAPGTGVLQGAFIHRTCRGQAAGGVRFWRYDTVEEFLRDGLRLARGMTHKNALAGLWWGGGKGVMVDEQAAPAGSPRRRRIYEEYGELLSSLRGCYVGAEDAGTSAEDMAAVFSRTRFTTCIPAALGGSGNPSAPTRSEEHTSELQSHVN